MKEYIYIYIYICTHTHTHTLIYIWGTERRNLKFTKLKCSIATLHIISSTWTSLNSNSGLRAHNPATDTYGVNGWVYDRVILELFNDSVSTTQTIYGHILILYNAALGVSYLVISYSAECLDDYRIVSSMATTAGCRVLGELRSARNYVCKYCRWHSPYLKG